jgi:MFS family permease
MELSGYRELWRTHGVMALLASSLLARLPVLATMVPVAFLAKDVGGSFRWAGIVAAAYSIGMAIAGPLWARRRTAAALVECCSPPGCRGVWRSGCWRLFRPGSTGSCRC